MNLCMDCGQLPRQPGQRWCSPCRSARRREAYRKDLALSRDKVYATSIKRRFGLDLADYNAMVDSQAGLCAICEEAEKARNKDRTLRRIQIDHDHSTGVVRACLCSRCNGGLAGFDDSTARMGRAIRYLVRSRRGT